MESEPNPKEKLRIGFDIIDSIGGYSFVLDAVVGHLIGALRGFVELELRDEEGAIFTIHDMPCKDVVEYLRGYLKTLRNNVRILAEDVWKTPPVKQLKIECEHEDA